MARHFFNLRHKPGPDGLAQDPDGNEIADPGLVRDYALTMARDLIARTHLDSVPNWFDCAFEIADEQGRAVMKVLISDAVPQEPDGS